MKWVMTCHSKPCIFERSPADEDHVLLRDASGGKENCVGYDSDIFKGNLHPAAHILLAQPQVAKVPAASNGKRRNRLFLIWGSCYEVVW